MRQAGALRRLAESFAAHDPDIACVHCIDEGDALALATRFDREWAYAGGTALLWRRDIAAARIERHRLPFALRRPFGRRSILHVHALFGDEPLAMIAASLGADRAARVRDLRAVRAVLRTIRGGAAAFIGNGADARAAFGDLGFTAVSEDGYNLIVVRPSQATPPPQTAGSHDASASIVRI